MACVLQAPSLALLVFKASDHWPELMELNALIRSKGFGQLLTNSVRAWADGRFNLGDTLEAVETGKDIRRPQAVVMFLAT